MKTFVAPRKKHYWSSRTTPCGAAKHRRALKPGDIEISTASTGAEALDALHDHPFDCCVLDLRLPDMSGFELLDNSRRSLSLRDVPIVVFTGKLIRAGRSSLRTAAKCVVLKNVQSPERLLDETALFLIEWLPICPRASK